MYNHTKDTPKIPLLYIILCCLFVFVTVMYYVEKVATKASGPSATIKSERIYLCLPGLRFQNKNLIMTDIQYSWLFRVRSTFNEGGYLSTGMGWKCNKYCGCVADPGSPSGVGRRMQTGEDWAPDVYSSLSFHWKKKDCVCKTNILVWQCWWNPLKTRDTPSFNLKITTYWKADFRYSSKREKELIW